jgi:hypothetical protein
VLTSFDDYPVHQTPLPVANPGTGDRNFYDRYFFNGYDADGELFFAVAMGLYPNRQVADASFSVLRDGVQTSLHTARQAAPERRDTRVGSIAVEVVEPLQRLRVRVDEGDLRADLTFDARSAPIEEPRTLAFNGPRVSMDSTRLTQFGRWSGSITVDGQTIEVRPDRVSGCRDRSWGIRAGLGEPEVNPPGPLPQVYWIWTPLQLADRCILFDSFEYADGRRWHEFGVVWPDQGEPTYMRAVDHDVDWRPGTRRGRQVTLRLEPAGGELLEVRMTPKLRFQMLGLGYLHPEWGHGRWHGGAVSHLERWRVDDLDPLAPQHIHVQQVCDVEVGDERGVGILEQLVIGPHERSGLRDLFDGAP